MNSTSPNFASILDEAPTEVVRPKPLPEGSYICIVQGQPEMTTSSKKKTPGIKFTFRPIEALEDVDEAALDEVGGLGERQLSSTFWLTLEAGFMLDQFHEACGIDLSDKISRRARNEMVINSQVIAVVKHRMSEDNTQAFAEIRSFAKV